MLKYLLSLQVTFAAFYYCNGQNKIIYRGDHSVLILDINNNHRYVIDTTLYYNEKLVGVEIADDSLTCNYSKSGRIFEKTYDISHIKDIPRKPGSEFTYAPKYDSYYKHNFYFKDYRFVSYNGGTALLKGEEILWNTSKAPFKKHLDSIVKPNNDLSVLAQHPVLSPDEKYFLYTSYRYGFFPSWAKLYEVEMSTGKMQLISKDGYYYYPSYSADGQYILYIGFSTGHFRLYNKKTKSNMYDYGFQDAFWLYK
ncbi:MAG: TolB family protein [Bacteroidota bacterium]